MMTDGILNDPKEDLSQPVEGGLTQPRAESPLEALNKKTEQPESTAMPSAPPAEPSVSPDAPSVKADAPAPSEPESTPAPDTDEFLKSILADDKNSNQNIPANSAAAPGVPSAFPEPEPAAKPPVPEIPEPVIPPEVPEPAAPPEVSGIRQDYSAGLENDLKKTQGESKIKDETPDLQGISAPTAPTDEKGGSVSGDLISSMQKNPSSGGSKKILSLIIIVVIVAIGGYSIYSMFFAKSKTSPSTTQTAVSPTASDLTTSMGSATVASSDLTRKSDLALIQQALINYSKDNNGSYPVSTEVASLSSPGNVLEKSLVPKYLTMLPSDPDTAKYFGYKSANGLTFSLTAALDNMSDPDAQVSLGRAIYTVTETTAIPTAASASATASQTTAAESAADTSTSGDFGF